MYHEKQSEWTQRQLESEEVHDDHANQQHHGSLFLRGDRRVGCLENQQTHQSCHRDNENDGEAGLVRSRI